MTEQSTYDDGMLDITAPDGPVEVKVREDRQVLWVNINGKCRLRVCQIDHEVIIDESKIVEVKLSLPFQYGAHIDSLPTQPPLTDNSQPVVLTDPETS
jgi:hypothetical protein